MLKNKFGSLLLGVALCFAAPLPVAALDFITAVSGGEIIAHDNDPRGFFKAGLTVAGTIYRDLAFEVGGSYSYYRFSYALLNYNPRKRTLGFNLTTSDEAKVNGAIDFTYPIWRGYARFDIIGGYHGVWLENGVSSYTVSGPHFGIGASKEFTFGTIAMRAGGTPVVTSSISNHMAESTLFKVEKSNSINLYGDPTAIFDYSITYWLPKMKWARLGIGYDGETISFQRTDRYYHAVSLFMKW